MRYFFLHLGTAPAETSPADPSCKEVADPGQGDPGIDLVRAWNASRGTVVAESVVWATGAAKRRGLLGRDRLDPGEGMFLVPCPWIHTFGMRFPIDVAFLARDGRVLAVYHSLRPNRLSRPVMRAQGVLELPDGVLHDTRTMPGDKIEFLDC